MTDKNSEASKHPPECPWHKDWHACSCPMSDEGLVFIVCSSEYRKDSFKIETVFANRSDAKEYIRLREQETIDNRTFMDFRLDVRTVHYNLPSYYKNKKKSPHDLFMEKLSRMTPEEQRQTLIASGILDSDGNFTEHYKELGE